MPVLTVSSIMSTPVMPIGPATKGVIFKSGLPATSQNIIRYIDILIGMCIILLVAVDSVVNNWVINDFVGDGYAFLTPIATVQNADQLQQEYQFASHSGLIDLSNIGYWMINTTVSALSAKSDSIFVLSVGWFTSAPESADQCKIFQATYPFDISQTPVAHLGVVSNSVTYIRGNAATHIFRNDLTENLAKAPIDSTGLDALGYVPGRIGTDMRLTTGISLVNTSTPQVYDVAFYKIYPKSFCSGCDPATELGFGHCNLTFVYNDSSKSVTITKSNNLLGSTYKLGLLSPHSSFSTASYYVKFTAILFAVGGFLASRRTVMWLEVDHTKTQSIASKIIRMVLPKYFPYPSRALRFDMFCYNSDIFSILFAPNEFV
ncbi:hypothetical protein THRCLA_07999 [Thraustotheca clavata]|uniref:Uncharacterized protein n=1 Tax=Thraustotheca clavata TaxID=74557 RepID=A0A1V9ZAZ4_9STRA|nr:hypothetical protein THRCLA_07999 [Thraustotheca clavata]